MWKSQNKIIVGESNIFLAFDRTNSQKKKNGKPKEDLNINN